MADFVIPQNEKNGSLISSVTMEAFEILKVTTKQFRERADEMKQVLSSTSLGAKSIGIETIPQDIRDDISPTPDVNYLTLLTHMTGVHPTVIIYAYGAASENHFLKTPSRLTKFISQHAASKEDKISLDFKDSELKFLTNRIRYESSDTKIRDTIDYFDETTNRLTEKSHALAESLLNYPPNCGLVQLQI